MIGNGQFFFKQQKFSGSADRWWWEGGVAQKHTGITTGVFHFDSGGMKQLATGVCANHLVHDGDSPVLRFSSTAAASLGPALAFFSSLERGNTIRG